MGGNGPSRLNADGGGVTLVQGIRLSDKVINRMKRSSLSQSQGPGPRSPVTPTATPGPVPSPEQLLPCVTPPSPPLLPTTPAPPEEAPPTPPLVEPVKLIPPPTVKFHSLPPSSVSAPPPPETKPPPHTSPVSSPPAEPSPPPAVFLHPPEICVPSSSEPEHPSTPPAAQHPAPAEPLPSPIPSGHVTPAAVFESPSANVLHSSPTVEATAADTVTLHCPADSAPVEALTQAEPPVLPLVVPAVDSAHPCELVPPSPPPESSLPTNCLELAVIPADASVDEPTVESAAPPLLDPLPPAEKPTVSPSVPPVEDETVTSEPLPAAALSVSPEVLEETLRKKIREDMQRSLEEEINQKRQELQRQLEEMKAQARAEAKAAAQARVEEQVKQTLAAEKAAYTEKLTSSIMKERMKTQNENLMVQLYWMELKAHQLDEKEKELQKRGSVYKERVAKLEAKCAELYKVTAESFQKGKEETHRRFTRFDVQPVCGDLQSQVLNCYKDNAGRTLSCSRIASAYMQCVDNAKKNKLSTGG